MDQHIKWADLPEDVVGMLATFLDPVGVLNYAIAAGKDLCRSIIKAYLNRNFIFLLENLETPSVFHAFLEANEEWRDMYDDPGLLSPTDRACFNTIFNDIRIAIRHGQVEVVQHLIEVRGVDINKKVNASVSGIDSCSLRLPLFFFASLRHNVPLLQAATQFLGAESDLSLQAAMAGIVSLLLSHPAIDINAGCDHNGVTPLHMVVRAPNAEKHILRQLLAHGDIDVNAATTNNGRTPLHYAVCDWCEVRDLEANVKCLIEAGADPWLRDMNGYSPLNLATKEQTVLMKQWWISDGITHSDNEAEGGGGGICFCTIV